MSAELHRMIRGIFASVRFLLDMELKTGLPIDDEDRIELLETIEAVEQKMEDEDADRVP